MTPQIIVQTPLAAAAGPWLAARIAQSIALRGRCRLALSGGSTPAGTLSWLARHLPAAAAAKLWVTWVDERAVLPDHPDANQRMARALWLDRAAVGAILPMYHAGALTAACDAFSTAFERQFDGGVDVVLLGVGGDGHIGSLFPGHDALAATGPCVGVVDSPKPPPERLTLTMPVLNAAGAVLVLARGAQKAEVLARAWAGAQDVPLGRLAPRGQYCWIIDEEAAAKLPVEAMKERR